MILWKLATTPKYLKEGGFFNMNYSTNSIITLKDVSISGKERPWRDKKLRNIELSHSFERLSVKAANEEERIYFKKVSSRVLDCGDFLKFEECPNDGHKHLTYANFCKNRLCSTCNWRRSKILHFQTMQILDKALEKTPNMKFIFLTLTIKRNTEAENLGDTITQLMQGFNRLFKYKKVDKITLGYMRVLEITYEHNRRKKTFDTYHPHYHVVIGVKPNYFHPTNKDYIKSEEWTSLWQKAMKLDYEPIINVKGIRSNTKGDSSIISSIKEVAKYTVKDDDFLINGNDELTDKVVECLHFALKHRRLIGYGKLFKEIKEQLALQDIDDDNIDLVGEGDKGQNCPLCNTPLMTNIYKWNYGLKNYSLYLENAKE